MAFLRRQLTHLGDCAQSQALRTSMQSTPCELRAVGTLRRHLSYSRSAVLARSKTSPERGVTIFNLSCPNRECFDILLIESLTVCTVYLPVSLGLFDLPTMLSILNALRIVISMKPSSQRVCNIACPNQHSQRCDRRTAGSSRHCDPSSPSISILPSSANLSRCLKITVSTATVTSTTQFATIVPTKP